MASIVVPVSVQPCYVVPMWLLDALLRLHELDNKWVLLPERRDFLSNKMRKHRARRVLKSHIRVLSHLLVYGGGRA